MRHSLLLFSLFLAAHSFAQTTKRPIDPRDVYRLTTVSDPKVSPDGNWVSYVLSSVDSAKNKRNSDVWMMSWDGQQSVQLTNSPDGESQARWSPDGKYLSFVSSRNGATNSQIWLLDRRGGEGKLLTALKGDLKDYAWSPDGKQIVLAMKTPESTDTSKNKLPKPLVMDRFHFKQDIEGYLEEFPTHLYLFDISTKKIDTLTQGKYDETSPVWSPNGQQIAFVSNRTAEPDKNQNTDIWVIDAKKNAPMKQITTWEGSDNAPVWSPDGQQLGFLRSSSPQYDMYGHSILCVVAKEGGVPTELSTAIDRPVSSPRWTKDGQSIGVLVTDDRQRYVATFSTKSKQMTKIVGGNRSFNVLESHPNGSWVSLMSEPQMPAELFAIENGATRRLTKHQEDFLAPLELAKVEGFTSKSKDGVQVSNFLFKPSNAVANQNCLRYFSFMVDQLLKMNGVST